MEGKTPSIRHIGTFDRLFNTAAAATAVSSMFPLVHRPTIRICKQQKQQQEQRTVISSTGYTLVVAVVSFVVVFFAFNRPLYPTSSIVSVGIQAMSNHIRCSSTAIFSSHRYES